MWVRGTNVVQTSGVAGAWWGGNRRRKGLAVLWDLVAMAGHAW